MFIGEVVEPAKVLQAQGTEVTKVKYGEVIWAGGCRVVAIFDSALDLVCCEYVGAVVEWVFPAYCSECPS